MSVDASSSPLRRWTDRTMANPSVGLPRRVTWFLCWAVVWVLVVWDFFLAADTVPRNTWSEVTRDISGAAPYVPWLLGMVVGHLFHPDDARGIPDDDAYRWDDEPRPFGIATLYARILLAAATAGVAIWSYTGASLSGWGFTIVALAGVVLGAGLWPKHRRAAWQW